jgi:hypothetical protein
MTQKEMGQLITVMSGVWANFSGADTEKIKTWHMIIGDIEFNVAKIAIMKLANTNTFAPSPAEIRNAVLEITTPSEKSKTAQEAWSDVMRIVKSNSYNYNSEKCKNEIKALGIKIERCVEYIGYSQLWNGNLENVPFIEKRFREFYDSLQDKEIRHDKLPESLQKAIAGIAGDVDVQKKLC